MRKLSPLRRLVRGMPCMLLAALLLFARLVSPSTAMPMQAADPDSVVSAILQVICHAPSADDASDPPRPSHLPGQEDCLLCPACHLVTQAALPAPHDLVGIVAIRSLIGRAAPLPPATGPPARPLRVAAHPTGPPSFSA